MTGKLDIYVDGACRGNPGPGSIGIVVYQNKERIKEIARTIGETTNNVAEYSAMICALQEALILRAEEVTVHTDSELMYNQLIGRYKIKDSKLMTLFEQVDHLSKGIRSLNYIKVPREENKEADSLATQCLKKPKQAKMVASLFDDGGEESPSSEG